MPKIPEYDVAVTGSGAGGGAVAGTLAREGFHVLLIEKGGPVQSPSHAMDAIARYYAHAGYHSVFGNILCSIPTGICLGGTTAINSGTCLKTPPPLLGRWQVASQGRFQTGEFEIYLDQAWQRLRAKKVPDRLMSPSCKIILHGARASGFPHAGPLERAEHGCQGAGRCCFVCPNQAKMTSVKAFLEDGNGVVPNVMKRAQLIHLERPDGSNKKLTLGLRDLDNNTIIKIRCRILVLACGALATPYFVRRYRLGPRPGRAGNNLSIHPAAKLFGLFDAPVNGWQGVPQAAGFQNNAQEDIRYEGVYTPPELAALTMPLESHKLRYWMDRYSQVATFGFMIKDSSRGRVRYPMGQDYPIVLYNMNLPDQHLMKRSALTLANIFLASGAKKVVLPLNSPSNILPRENLGATHSNWSPRRMQMMAFHPLGTCAMGSVVDENLQIEPGIYIGDGSVIPESLGVNPQITIYAFALRLARHLAKKLRDA
ncbi:MAG: GMC family oxidoreductase [Elusimicrobia bacterium]|nr:GMC family oxidoreductase [Elusimicrobiota bacterium]